MLNYYKILQTHCPQTSHQDYSDNAGSDDEESSFNWVKPENCSPYGRKGFERNCIEEHPKNCLKQYISSQVLNKGTDKK